MHGDGGNILEIGQVQSTAERLVVGSQQRIEVEARTARVIQNTL